MISPDDVRRLLTDVYYEIYIKSKKRFFDLDSITYSYDVEKSDKIYAVDVTGRYGEVNIEESWKNFTFSFNPDKSLDFIRGMFYQMICTIDEL